MNIDLSPEVAKRLSDSLSRGLDADAVVLSGLDNQEALQHAVRRGFDQIDAGDVSSRKPDEIAERALQRYLHSAS